MLFVEVCAEMNDADHRILIPLHCVTRVYIGKDRKPDTVVVKNGEGGVDVYYTDSNGFYWNVIEIEPSETR